MRSADVVNTLLQKASSIGLSPRRTLPERIDARLFLRQRYALYCGRHHALFEADAVRVADLASQPFVSFSGDKVGDHLSPLTIFRDEMGLTGPVVASSSSMLEIKRFIYAGLGIGCLPEHAVLDEVVRGRFRKLPPEDGVADVDLHFLWVRDRKLSAAESAFVTALHAFLDRRDAADAEAEAVSNAAHAASA